MLKNSTIIEVKTEKEIETIKQTAKILSEIIRIA